MTVIIFILVLAILIIVHEFGHFIIAKKSGIRVDEFGLGFPPKAYGYKPKGSETTYSLNWIPFGGFVRIFGEDPTDETAVDGPESSRSFINKSKSTQAFVIVGGVLFNIIFAWILFSGGLMYGMPYAVDDRYADRIGETSILVTSVMGNSPAEVGEMLPGDSIVSLNGVEELTVDSVQEYIAGSEGEEITLTVERAGENVELKIVPETGLIGDVFAVGISMSEVGTLKLPVHLAMIEAARISWDMIVGVTVGFSMFIFEAVTGSANLAGISGPVGIAGLIGDASMLGFIHLITFTAFISINLAVLNMIPFPALDGGRLLFILIEKIKGSPINPKIAGTLNFIGFALLILLLVVVTYNDIVRLF